MNGENDDQSAGKNVAPQPDLSTERDKRVAELANYISKEILDTTKHPAGVNMQAFTGEWWPSFKWNPEATVGFMYDSLSELATKFEEETGKKPTFLDLGSGVGEVASVASATRSFSHCYGIENRANVVELGKRHQREMEERGIVPSENITQIAASYYTSETWKEIGQGSLKPHVRKMYDGTSEGDVKLEQTDLLDADGKLKADVVYWYPSDPYVAEGAKQWKDLVKSGAYLIMGPSGQLDTLRSAGALDEFELVESKTRPTENIADSLTFSNLYVYQRK